MNTRQFFTRLALFLFIAPAALAQVQISIMARSPMPPQLSAWERDRSLVQVAIINPAGSPGHNGARFCFTVRNAETGEVVVRTNDADPDIPRISIPPGPATMMRYGPDLITPAAITVDPRYRDVARATSSLPEGRYEFCVRLLDANGGEIATTGNTCGRFTVVLPDPPQLLEPGDGAAIAGTSLPRFTWTPSIPTGFPPQYRLRIMPVYGHQNRETAVERNAPAVDRILPGTIYQYSPADPSLAMFPAADSFAWQVTLQEPGGAAMARSEVFTFSIGGSLDLNPRNDGENPPATGDDVVKDDPCKKKLEELRQALAEALQKAGAAEDAADDAETAAANPPCQKQITDMEKEIATLEAEVKDLKAQQDKILREMRDIHGKEGFNFGWSLKKDGTLRYGAISPDAKWLGGAVTAGAVKLARELDKLNKEYKEKLAKLKKLREDLAKLKKECEKEKAALKAEAEKKRAEAKKAREEADRLRKEYEQAKKDCPEDEKGAGDNSGSGNRTGGDSGNGTGSGSGNPSEGEQGKRAKDQQHGSSLPGSGSDNGIGDSIGRDLFDGMFGGNRRDDSIRRGLPSDGTIPIELIQLDLRSTRPLGAEGDGSKNRAVDCSRIRVSRGTAATGGMVIHGSAGSADPGATVTITDQNGRSVTVTAGADGSFTLRESDLPEGFDHTPGHVLRFSDGKSICTVIIDK